MIIGDPYKFAIVIDIVDKWSSSGFISGVFYISIDGYLFPRNLVNTTLNSELYIFFENANSSLLTKPVDISLFKEEKAIAYRKLYLTTFPEQNDDTDDYAENNYLYSCGFNEMEGEGCYLFSVSDGKQIRILGAEVVNDEFISQANLELDKNIREVFISISELEDIIRQLREYYDKTIVSKNVNSI